MFIGFAAQLVALSCEIERNAIANVRALMRGKAMADLYPVRQFFDALNDEQLHLLVIQLQVAADAAHDELDAYKRIRPLDAPCRKDALHNAHEVFRGLQGARSVMLWDGRPRVLEAMEAGCDAVLVALEPRRPMWK
jgi:hypothetical protein